MRLRTTIIVGAVMSAAAWPAHAQPPSGSVDTCAPTYDAMTREMILEQANSNGVPEERATAMFDKVNKNGDSWICQEQLPGDNHYNFIDNPATGR